MKSGYIYVLSNQSMPGIVKIGRSIHGGKSRARDLYQTGVPTPFKLEFEIYVEDHVELEILVHEKLQDQRVSGNREFFKVDVFEATALIMGLYAEYFDMQIIHIDLMVNEADVYLYAHKLMIKYPEQYKENMPLVLEIYQAIGEELEIEQVHEALEKRKERIEARKRGRRAQS